MKIETGIIGVALLSTTAYAQQDSENIGSDISKGAAQEATSTEIAEFRDTGNATAKAVAEANGISVGEATRRLKIQRNAQRLERRLSERFPDSFGGIFFDEVNGKFTVFAGFAKAAPPSGQMAALVNDPELMANVETTPVKLSNRDETRFAERMGSIFPDPIAVDYSIDKRSGVVSVFDDPGQAHKEQVETLAREFGLSVVYRPDLKPSPTAIMIGGGFWGGQSYLVGSTREYPICTMGFAAFGDIDVRQADGTYRTERKLGLTTAGHCASGRASTSDPATWQPNTPSEYNAYDRVYGDTGGIALDFDTRRNNQWSSGIDLQFQTHLTSDQISPHYWNGSQSVPVLSRSAAPPSVGADVCKWGRTTKWDCGKVEAVSRRSTDSVVWSFTMYSPSGADMAERGDSGGPVALGNEIIGWVYAEPATENKRGIAHPITLMYEKTSVRVAICTSC